MTTDPSHRRPVQAAATADRREIEVRATLSLLETALEAVAMGRSDLALRAFEAARRREARAGLEPAGLRARAAWNVARRRGLAPLAALVLLLAPLAGSAEPMDLGDRAARWVAVRFEVSPPDRPGRTDAVYSAPFVARLEPGARANEARITIPGRTVEERLLRDHDPVPGSFSDFVWAFDTESGHVISATVSGRVMRMIDWGLGRSRMEARVQFEMDTLRAAGFERPRRLMGQHVNPYCAPDGGEACSPVAPSAYDGSTGYVNAVGPVVVETHLMRLRTFSTLGEAVFSELEPPGDRMRAALARSHK